MDTNLLLAKLIFPFLLISGFPAWFQVEFFALGRVSGHYTAGPLRARVGSGLGAGHGTHAKPG